MTIVLLYNPAETFLPLVKGNKENVRSPNNIGKTAKEKL